MPYRPYVECLYTCGVLRERMRLLMSFPCWTLLLLEACPVKEQALSFQIAPTLRLLM